DLTGSITNKGARDLVVLRYMAQKIRVMLHSIEKPTAASCLPLRYSLEVCHHRQQRVVLYDPQSLLQNTTLSFVGFVGAKQKMVDPHVDNELQKVDALLAKELVNAPGLLCYSSLELRAGKWYNLVLLSDFNLKTHLKNSATHSCGAYQLAPYYYEWIRIHSGRMPDGLARNALLLQKTKYYTCQPTKQRFTVHEYMHH
ncbi:MAG TPA: hypothetical protein VGL94_04115, partial [Ktedonobacteraceae bacterium]